MLDNIKSTRDNIKIKQVKLLSLLNNIKSTRDNIKSTRDHIKIKQDKLLSLPDNFKSTRDNIKSTLDHIKSSWDHIKIKQDILLSRLDALDSGHAPRSSAGSIEKQPVKVQRTVMALNHVRRTGKNTRYRCDHDRQAAGDSQN